MRHPIFKFTQLNRHHHFKGNLHDFERAIKYCEEVKILKTGLNKFKLEAETTFGVDIDNAPEPISIFVTVSENTEGGCTIHFSSEIRHEHFSIACIFLFLICSVLLTSDLKFIAWVIILWPITQYWFYRVYWAQENSIAEDLIKKLKIFELHFI